MQMYDTIIITIVFYSLSVIYSELCRVLAIALDCWTNKRTLLTFQQRQTGTSGTTTNNDTGPKLYIGSDTQ